MYTCKCHNLYCGKHLHNHECTYDHFKDQQKLLCKKMPIIKSDRGLVKI